MPQAIQKNEGIEKYLDKPLTANILDMPLEKRNISRILKREVTAPHK